MKEYDNQQKEFMERKEEFYRYPERYRVEPFRIMGNLYFIGNQDVAAYLLDTEEGVIILDTGYPTTQGLLIYSIMKLGFSMEQIRIILHTHGHFDHMGATALLKQLSGQAVTYMGWRDGEMLEKQPEMALAEISGCPYFSVWQPDQLLHDNDVVSLGTTQILAVETPGHTDGTLSYFFFVKEGGVQYRCGLMGGAGLNTLTRAFIQRHKRSYAREEFLQSICKIYQEKVDINLGNHSLQNFTLEKRKRMLAGEGGNPFVDSGEWQRFLDKTRVGFEKMIKNERE